MTDIILGMGEVGETLFDLLVDRKFDCIGIDLEDSKCKNYTENKIIEKCKSEKSEILDSISSSGKLEEDVEKSLTEIITELKKNFNS